jgi:DnaJ-class molecular chaperone
MIPKKTFNSVVVCHECKGKGIVWKREFKGHSRGYESTPETCPVCKGHKVLNRKVTVELFTI